MMLRIASLTAATFLMTATGASAQPPCSQYTGSARTACLNAEMRASQQRTQEIDRNNKRLDYGIAAAKAGVAVGGAAAVTAGAMTGGPAGAARAGSAYVNGVKAGTEIGKKIGK